MPMPTQGVCAAMGSCVAIDGGSRGRRRRLAGEDRLLSEITEAGERGSGLCWIIMRVTAVVIAWWRYRRLGEGVRVPAIDET